MRKLNTSRRCFVFKSFDAFDSISGEEEMIDCKCASCMQHPNCDVRIWNCDVITLEHDVELLFPNRKYGVTYDEQTKTSKVYIIHYAKDFRLTIRQVQGIEKSGFHIVGIEPRLIDCETDDYNQLTEYAKIKTIIYLERNND